MSKSQQPKISKDIQTKLLLNQRYGKLASCSHITRWRFDLDENGVPILLAEYGRLVRF